MGKLFTYLGLFQCNFSLKCTTAVSEEKATYCSLSAFYGTSTKMGLTVQYHNDVDLTHNKSLES